MKQSIILTAIVILCLSFKIQLKESNNSLVPEMFAYFFSAIDPATGKIKAKLENTTAVYQKPKGKSTNSVYTISGSKSAVRLKIAEAVFQTISDQSTGTLNPSLYLSLYKLSSGKSNRTLTISPDGSNDAMLLPVSIVQTYPLYYRISVNVAILPGEYAFVDKTTTASDGNVSVWTFGID